MAVSGSWGNNTPKNRPLVSKNSTKEAEIPKLWFPDCAFLKSFSFYSPFDIVSSMSPKLQTYDYSNQLLASQDFFARSTRVLEEADSAFRPQEGMMTVAQQGAHTAPTPRSFIEGASRPEGFDLDFEKHAKVLNAVTSLAAARQTLAAAYANAIQFLRSAS